LLSGVSVGDWLSLTNVLVEEYRGNTILQYDGRYDPDFVVESSGNAVPAAKRVSMAEIAAPVEGPAEFFLVANHDAEKYESMRLTVVDGNVTEMDLGKADDNYSLHGATADVWASDYLNVDRAGDYHPDVFIGQRFASVTGILEQYTKIESTYAWDYYQLLTTSASDLIIPEPSTIILLAGSMAVLSVMRSSRRR